MVESKPKNVDFHVHYDDVNVNGVLVKAANSNTTAIGLIGRGEYSLHLDVIISEGKKMGVEVIPGVENVSTVGNQAVDLIALGFDYTSPAVLTYWGKDSKKQVKINQEVAHKQKEFLESKGYKITPQDQFQMELLNKILGGEITEKAINFCWIVTSNPENEALVKQEKITHKEEWQEVSKKYGNRPGYVEDPVRLESKFLWSVYFEAGKEGFVPVLLSSDKVINVIHKAGGIVLYSPEGKFDKKLWEKLIDQGVDGIMGWHGGKFRLEKDILLDIKHRGLLILGGSDYNPDLNHWQPGVGDGTLFLSERRLLDYKNYLGQKHQRS